MGVATGTDRGLPDLMPLTGETTPEELQNPTHPEPTSALAGKGLSAEALVPSQALPQGPTPRKRNCFNPPMTLLPTALSLISLTDFKVQGSDVSTYNFPILALQHIYITPGKVSCSQFIAF